VYVLTKEEGGRHTPFFEMNTAIASAKDPILMAEAMRLGVESGRKAYLAGRIPKKLYATASSPLDGILA
jgi:thiazole synthase